MKFDRIKLVWEVTHRNFRDRVISPGHSQAFPLDNIYCEANREVLMETLGMIMQKNLGRPIWVAGKFVGLNFNE
jgi:hypothetical protein